MEEFCGVKQQESINMTAAMEALCPLLNNPRRTIHQAEAFTSGIILMLLLQLILGSFRRQSTSFLVQGGTWLTYTLSFPAIAYTLGLMQSSPVKNVMYPIWAASLLMAAGCTNSVKVYELNDNRQWKRSSFNTYQYFIYTSLICWLLLPYSISVAGYFHQVHDTFSPSRYFEFLKSPASVVSSLVGIVLLTGLMGRELACVAVDLGYFGVKRVAELMKKPPTVVAPTTASGGDGFDPTSMKGYKYPVHISKSGEDVTIDQIWHCEGRLLSSGTDHRKDLKDSCLAYAMFQLLKRRYYGISFAEEHLDETHDFVFKGLLQKEDDYERAFRIVEMELGFCHDYFFTKHAIIFELEAVFFFLFLVKIILIATCVSFVTQSTLSVKTLSPIIEVHTKKTDDIITLLVLATLLLIEILQAAFYLASDWCKVSVTCRYVKKSRYQHSAFIEKLIVYISRLTIFGYWKNKIGQYSVISHIRAADLRDNHPVNMLQTVKRAIARSLIACDGAPTNGEGSLGRNGVFGEFSWALQGRSQVEIMLIWNIATDYCNMTPATGDGESVNGRSENEQDTKFNRNASVSLSRYCAYLMNSSPQLLPGYFGDTKLAMADVNREAEGVLGFSNFSSRGSFYQAMNRLPNQVEHGSIFMKGVKLGKQLEGMPSSAVRWKILADFWAEKILYVAPSDNVKGHMELLAKGGELLTHIWVLLTHAGILKINREEDNTMPRRQPSQGDV